ncbi:rhomboid family intramembrane serine protease [Mycobacterium sp. ACS4331]|uniref:rhomboid family intramembrane serine protease n=1 Tax=Mycobacterium sp. ACS4331 TaxID=1834121 RepID=UPI000801E818|nr:rhomboid family intramembrane serine protease [Mycobacterium sp. ACS4331]OBF28515.1 rhomboid family intramembrane serine protease [Mycobacterium sp. ACS4331]
MSYPGPPHAAPQTPVCYRHPDRVTYVTCTRCHRPICGDCMRSAAVGHQCVDCVQEAAASVRAPKTQFGGTLRTATTPVVTWTLIGLNVLAFVLQMAVGQLEPDFALWPNGVAHFDQWYRLITSAFLHDGTLHILFNMWALYIVGPALEMWLGRLRYVALYVLSLLGGSVAVYLLSDPSSLTLGASGAVFGLFGATFVIGRRLNLDVRWVAALILINVVITVVAPAMGAGPISWQGHLGGLVTGSIVGAAFAYAPAERRAAVGAGVTAALLVVFAVLLWWRTGVLIEPYRIVVG